jgi:hypothetical protein
MNLGGTGTALGRALIARGARCAPSSLSARLAEEWLAELAARGGPLSQLRFGVGCYWAGHAIARADWASGPVAPPALEGNQTLSAVWDPKWVCRRAVAALCVLTLHVALLYTLTRGVVPDGTTLIPTRNGIIISGTPRRATTDVSDQ